MNKQEELERDKKHAMAAMIINHNGHVAYQIFTGKTLTGPIKITALSAPFSDRPTAVGFVDKDLANQLSANDVDNPDGAKAPEALVVSAPIAPPPVKKKNHLKSVK